MAFLRTKDDNYLCMSTDEKLTTGMETGTICTEVDTGARFIWYNGSWEDDLSLIYAIKEAVDAI